MANFFLDNEDIQFLFNHIDMEELAKQQEDDFKNAGGNGDDYGPLNAADAVDNYRRTLTILGEICGEMIAPHAEQVDHEGNTLNDDGTVTLHPLVQKNLDRLTQGDMMGFTLPRRYGGLNCPNVIYTIANELVARADCSLTNLFGLQGIAETIYAFANDEIRNEYLPLFCEGKVTGAMVLTEPDAGSDLQAVRLRAYQDESGNWLLNGVKRFITNGCGEVLLVLARSEPEIGDGRGLSLFVADRGPTVRVRHLEEKLGIHGSPTCELVFDDTPCRLIGERQRGLITYVMALMNGARVGIASQSLGVGEAAFRLARNYAHTRRQFGVPIERLPAVAELVTDMKIDVEAARALAYETSRVCDQENNNARVLEWGGPLEKDEEKRRKQLARALKRMNGMLTPMCKYYCSEMSVRVSHNAIQVLGGSGYMKDYAAERYLRDSRITTIYEGTSQLQVVAAVRGVSSGSFATWTDAWDMKEYGDPLLIELKQKLLVAKQQILEAIQFIKTQSPAYMDLAGRRLVDSSISVIIGHLFLGQGAANPRKKRVARRFIDREMSVLRMNLEQIHAGDMAVLAEYEVLAGPVPAND
ncbi:MAG: acyl-CoA dehydrogenase family protein [Planctomycetota bacterium]